MIDLLRDFTALNWLELGIGVSLGVMIIFLLMARQVWADRWFFGYDVYSADARRRRLLRGAVFALLIGIAVSGLFVAQTLHLGEPVSSGSSAVTTPTPDPLVGMKLIIPRMGIKTDIIPAHIVGYDWDISQLTTQAAHLDGTVYPGQPGNAVLAGHITIPGAGWGPFHELETLQLGDEVSIQTADNQTIVYTVVQKMTVAPTEVNVALPHGDTRLTLLTCGGWDSTLKKYTERLVVVAIHAS